MILEFLTPIRSKLNKQILINENWFLLLFLLVIWLCALFFRFIIINSVPIQVDEASAAQRLYIYGSNFNLLYWLFWPIFKVWPGAPLSGREWVVWPFVELMGYSHAIFFGRFIGILISTAAIPLLYFLRREMTPSGAAIGGTILALSTILIRADSVWKGGNSVQTILILNLVFVAWYIRSKKKLALVGLAISIMMGTYFKADLIILGYCSWIGALILYLYHYAQSQNTSLFNLFRKYIREREITRFYIIGAIIASLIGVVFGIVTAYFERRIIGFLKWVDYSYRDPGLLYYIEYITSNRHYLWFTLLGILGILFLILFMQRMNVEQGLWFYTLCVCWFASMIFIMSAMDYKFDRLSQFFVVPLALCSGVLGVISTNYLPAIIEKTQKMIPQLSRKTFWSKFNQRSVVQTMVVSGIFALSLLAVVLAQLPGITAPQIYDYQKDASDYVLENLDANQSLLQVGTIEQPWQWYFIKVREENRYKYYEDTSAHDNNFVQQKLRTAENTIVLFSDIGYQNPIFTEIQAFLSAKGTEKIFYSPYDSDFTCKVYIIP
ncbi:MAG: hypothetical protein ACFFBD_29590 [Candidatus Hodarchaeota archaeon]